MRLAYGARLFWRTGGENTATSAPVAGRCVVVCDAPALDQLEKANRACSSPPSTHASTEAAQTCPGIDPSNARGLSPLLPARPWNTSELLPASPLHPHDPATTQLPPWLIWRPLACIRLSPAPAGQVRTYSHTVTTGDAVDTSWRDTARLAPSASFQPTASNAPSLVRAGPSCWRSPRSSGASLPGSKETTTALRPMESAGGLIGDPSTGL